MNAYRFSSRFQVDRRMMRNGSVHLGDEGRRRLRELKLLLDGTLWAESERQTERSRAKLRAKERTHVLYAFELKLRSHDTALEAFERADHRSRVDVSTECQVDAEGFFEVREDGRTYAKLSSAQSLSTKQSKERTPGEEQEHVLVRQRHL